MDVCIGMVAVSTCVCVFILSPVREGSTLFGTLGLKNTNFKHGLKYYGHANGLIANGWILPSATSGSTSSDGVPLGRLGYQCKPFIYKVTESSLVSGGFHIAQFMQIL